MDVYSGYILVLDKLVTNEEYGQVQSELRNYISEHGVFSNLHVTKDRDWLNHIEWWNMYSSSTTHLQKLVVRVVSLVVNTYSTKRCWSTYSFIHNIKRNITNVV
jgi:hypothetical protein